VSTEHLGLSAADSLNLEVFQFKRYRQQQYSLHFFPVLILRGVINCLFVQALGACQLFPILLEISFTPGEGAICANYGKPFTMRRIALAA
jgi:hypothetical protein